MLIASILVLACSGATLIVAAHYSYEARQYSQAAITAAAACAAAHEDDAEQGDNGRHLSLAPPLRAAED